MRRLFGIAVAVFSLASSACNEKLEVLHTSLGPSEPGMATPLVTKPVCDAPIAAVAVDHPTTIVGTGTPASCTAQALAQAVVLGGVVVFRCGPQPATVQLSSEILVTRDAVVDGSGLITLGGGDATRIFHLRGADAPNGPRLTLQNLTLERGAAPLVAGDDVASSGGAVLQEGGTLVVQNCAFRHNATSPDAASAVGGAIGGHGGATIIGSIFEDNTSAGGGALGYGEGSLDVVNSRLESNTASTRAQSASGGRGGAVAIVTGTSQLAICGTTVSKNSSTVLGGAMFLSMIGGGTATIDRSTFDSNSCSDPSSDPAADAGIAGSTGRVGGIYAQGVALSVTSSTISNNQAAGLSALFVIGFADRQVAGSLELVNSTIANNRAFPRMPVTQTGIGGGVWIDADVTGHILNSTIAGNESQFGAGIIGFSSLTIDNSIISNTALNIYNPINCTDLPTPSAAAQGAHDLQWPAMNGSGPDQPCASGTTFADPMLSDLAIGDGPTATMAPKPGSAAIGQGQGCTATDQRGKPRKTPCTVGAYESGL
jgi:hypothetical protein